jgi:polysaccharide biosynthesis protein PslG
MPKFKTRKAVTLVMALFCIIVAAVVFALTRIELPGGDGQRLLNVDFSFETFTDLFRGPDHDPFRGAAITDPPFTSLTYSVQVFIWWDDGIYPGLTLEWVRLMGFTHVKQTFAWRDVEPIQGEWHFPNGDRIVDHVERQGLELIIRLSDTPDWARPPGLPRRADGDYVDTPPADLADWANYCGQIAARYRGRVAAYQIWNEPNLRREWGDQPPNAAGYVEMLRLCSEAIRAADPDAILISAGLSPTGQHDDMAHRDDIYLQQMYDLGFQEYIDVVGVHAPGYTIPGYGPDDAERDGFGRWATFRRVEDLRKIMIRNGDAARQMAILEVGYTTDPIHETYHWFAVDEEAQARNLGDAYRFAATHWRPWIGLMSAIYLAKPSWTPEDEEFWWAFNDPQTGRMRPVFGEMVQMEKYCGDVYVPRRSPEETTIASEHNPCR